jgi:predicted nucleotidyltransferase
MDAAEADELHERSRALLVATVRKGVVEGLSQREIAEAVGRSQPEVSRLLRFQGASPLARRLAANRRDVSRIARRHGATNVRVFGSVARGTDNPNSDIDLLVDLAPGMGLFALARLEFELGELLDARVDVSPARSLRANLSEQVMSEAVPL